MVLLARPALQLLHQRRVAPVHPLQAGLDLGAIGEQVQPFGAGAQLAGSLRPAQQQHGEHRALVVGQVEDLREGLVVLQRAPSGVGPHDAQQTLVLERPGGLFHRPLVELHHRLTATGLVAGGAEAGERERVRRGNRHLLLQQAAQDPLLDRLEVHAQTLLPHGPCGGRLHRRDVLPGRREWGTVVAVQVRRSQHDLPCQRVR